ncbi:MAG TPA: sulfatase-like hydrolase/transferase, partial [Isosphaeraceae bacterium]|nr:sulfatase-like hydrolase/transferase [Isosphaeraceae bacterium]
MRNDGSRILHPHRAVWVVLACALLASLMAVQAEGASKPNMIFVLADDLGYGDLPCLNPDSTLKTPSADRMAREGMLFTDAHSGASLCTPTRYGVLTGRYCWRSSLKRGVLGGFSPPLIERDRLTVAGMLKQQGYHTAAFGKWHLGMTWPTSDGQRPGTGLNEAGNKVDFSKKIEHAPTTRGFDRFWGISASLDMPPYVFIKDDHVEELPTETQEKRGYVRRGPKGPTFEFEEVLPRLTREVVSYVQQQKADQPFFVYFALNAPHTPIVPAKPFRGKSQVGDYGDFVQEVDWALGEVLKALDDKGLAENTLVIF